MATKQHNTRAAANDIQSLFDPQGYQDVFKTWARMNERFTGLMVDAAARTTDISHETTQEALSNLRDASQVRDEPAEYGQAYSEFAQKQMDLFMRTAQSLAEVTQKTASDATDLASEAGQQIGDKAAANTQGAADKAGSAAKKAA